jgi:hypothetical protein
VPIATPSSAIFGNNRKPDAEYGDDIDSTIFGKLRQRRRGVPITTPSSAIFGNNRKSKIAERGI